MARRHYGTGSLRQVGQSWIGSWYGPDDRRIKRRIGAVRTPGESDGLTKAQAEKEFARLREDESIVARHARRVTMTRPAPNSASARAPRAQEVPPPHRRLRPAQPHRALLRGQGPRADHPTGHRALRGGQAQDAGDQDGPQPSEHDPFGLRAGPSAQVVPDQPREARRAAGDQDDRDPDQVPRPGRTGEAAGGRLSRTMRSGASRRPCT